MKRLIAALPLLPGASCGLRLLRRRPARATRGDADRAAWAGGPEGTASASGWSKTSALVKGSAPRFHVVSLLPLRHSAGLGATPQTLGL